jgi:arylsulfatase I/J
MFSGILATAHLVVVHLLSAAFGFEADAVMPATTAAQPPHILLAVIDDLGWAEVGYHRAESTPEVQTPTIDKLVAEGVELNRHYVHMTCTPSRSALQTGRLPIHVTTQLSEPCDKNGAIPRNMTGLAAQLKKAGYATHQVGKWDCGMATPSHTPHGRGYDTSLTYFGHGNWMWSETEWGGSGQNESWPEPGLVDFWDTDRPARHLNGTGYEEELFRARILAILAAHDQATPLFLNYDSKIAHYPLQAPIEYQQRFASITDDNRRVYHAMVAYLDDQLANITGTMRQLGMWERTLMILTSDNGGYVKSPNGACVSSTARPPSAASDHGHGTACFNGEAGANNWPLRGGKYSMFEGGIRVTAFASGGYLPRGVRGTKLEGMMHVADWYATLCGLAGVDPTDEWAAASGLPAVDSLDMWPLLSGANLTSPRTSILVTSNLLVHNEWKYVRPHSTMVEAAWGGPHYPNASTATDPIDGHTMHCPARGCLFNVVADPEERHEVAADYPDVVARLQQEMDAQARTIWSTSHAEDPTCLPFAKKYYGGFYGPWLELPPSAMVEEA